VDVISLLLYGFVALVAVGVLFVLAVRFLPAGEQIAPPAPDVKLWTLADHELSSQDVIDVRLPVALRGYRFAETDALLDRLSVELRDRDAEIARLRQHPVDVPDYDPTAVREQ
jgi:hypothetical protein